MPRQLRIQYEYATYHVLARDYRREAIFRDDRDRKEFLSRLETVCGKTGLSLRAHVLMGNHYHLVRFWRSDAPDGGWSRGNR